MCCSSPSFFQNGFSYCHALGKEHSQPSQERALEPPTLLLAGSGKQEPHQGFWKGIALLTRQGWWGHSALLESSPPLELLPAAPVSTSTFGGSAQICRVHCLYCPANTSWIRESGWCGSHVLLGSSKSCKGEMALRGGCDCKASSDTTPIKEGHPGRGASQLELFATQAARKKEAESGYCTGRSR